MIKHFESLSHTNTNSEQRESSFVLKLFVQRYQRVILLPVHSTLQPPMFEQKTKTYFDVTSISPSLTIYVRKVFLTLFTRYYKLASIRLASLRHFVRSCHWIVTDQRSFHYATSTPLFYKTPTFNVESRLVSLL